MPLGEFEVTGIPPGPAGQSVDIRFTYDLNGVLEVEATVTATRKTASHVIARHAKGLSEAQSGSAPLANPGVESNEPVGSRPAVPSFAEEVLKFFKAEGVAAVLEGGGGGDGTVFLTGRAGNRQDRSQAAVLASPPVITLAAEHYNRLHRLASRLFERAGAPPEALLPLMRRTIDNGFELTGPIARGDWAIVDAHLAAIHEAAPDIEVVYRALAQVTTP